MMVVVVELGDLIDLIWACMVDGGLPRTLDRGRGSTYTDRRLHAKH
jgi:hypothetical protein